MTHPDDPPFLLVHLSRPSRLTTRTSSQYLRLHTRSGACVDQQRQYCITGQVCLAEVILNAMNPTLGDPNSNPISPQGPSSLANPQSTSTRNFSSTGYSTGAPPVPQISTTFHQSDSTSRPTTMSASHSYSRSSPAANVEHKYTPFPNTPESSKYSSTSSSKHYIPHTPTGAPSQSPLALTDIRPPRTELHMGDDLTSPSAALLQEPSITQVTSCYNAPWPIYAYDWCKWPVSAGNGVGKMAICSYLEDSHNYVSGFCSSALTLKRRRGPFGKHAAQQFLRKCKSMIALPVSSTIL